MLNKLEKSFFYLLIFCLPFQTRKILYLFTWDFNEWSAIYLYLTDLLILSLFGCWIWRKRKDRFLKEKTELSQKIKTPGFWLGVFLLVTLFSLINAPNLSLGFYVWLKLAEMIFLFFYLKNNLKLFKLKKIAGIFILSGIFQTLIAWLQFINQKSLGLWFFRESPLDLNLAGVAKISVQGLEMIRGYGAFPHPNLLAVFLLVALFFVIWLWKNIELTKFKRCLLIISYFILSFGLLISFSRSVILIYLILSLIYFLIFLRKSQKQKNKALIKKVLELIFLFIIVVAILAYSAWPELISRFNLSAQEQAISLRLFYTQFSWDSISQFPLLGIGWGNFVWQMQSILTLFQAWVFQPVHNIYLLIAVESGLLGLVCFLLFLFYLFRKIFKNYFWLILVIAFLMLGFADHYFFTLQQGQLLFWLILGISLGLENKKTPLAKFNKSQGG